MSNLLTFSVESTLGAFLITGLAIGFGALLFVMSDNFNSDMDILGSNYNEVEVSKKTTFITPFEKTLIVNWLAENNLSIPEGHGYKYILEQYPDRPWLKTVE
jgi:hypothetical protein